MDLKTFIIGSAVMLMSVFAIDGFLGLVVGLVVGGAIPLAIDAWPKKR